MLVAEAMTGALGLHVKQGIKQVGQHGVLSRLRESPMEFEI